MKTYFTIFVYLTTYMPLFAQKHDYIWIGGEANESPDPQNGGFVIDFNTTPVTTSYHFRELDLFVSCACISDSNGVLQAYTDGCDIASGYDDQIMVGGNDINPGYVNSFQCHHPDGIGSYTAGIQSSLFLPLPDTADMYYLFHKRIIYTNNPFDVVTDMLFYSVIDMKKNQGKGEVIAKNVPLMEDTLSYGQMTAVKHANGKDWWVLTNRRRNDQYYCFLLTHAGIVDTVFQQIGDRVELLEGGTQMCFSPDGSKLALHNTAFGVHLFDFDRTTGLLSNFRQIVIDYINFEADFGGCVISPNSRYLYLTSALDLYQFDLQAEDIAATQQLIGEWDETWNPLPTAFAQCHLGPDCKIYIQTSQQSYNLHVIHHPDEGGTACDLEQRGLTLPRVNRGSLPYFPNYRLGPTENPGLPCTETVSVGGPVNPLLPAWSVFPNPAYETVKIIGNRDTGSRVVVYTLSDMTGRVWAGGEAAAQGATTTIDVTGLPAGMYIWQVGEQTGKLVVLH